MWHLRRNTFQSPLILSNRGSDRTLDHHSLHVCIRFYAPLNQIDLLLKRGANANAADSYGQTPLHYVAETSRLRVKLAEQLIEKANGNVNYGDNAGETPLGKALQLKGERYYDLIRLFLEKGHGDPNRAYGNGSTPMQLFLSSGILNESRHVTLKMFQLLLRYGGTVSSREFIVDVCKGHNLHSSDLLACLDNARIMVVLCGVVTLKKFQEKVLVGDSKRKKWKCPFSMIPLDLLPNLQEMIFNVAEFRDFRR